MRNTHFCKKKPLAYATRLPNGQQAIVSDTVGFIRNLPTELVAAFSATLEEVVEADIILHVHARSRHQQRRFSKSKNNSPKNTQ